MEKEVEKELEKDEKDNEIENLESVLIVRREEEPLLGPADETFHDSIGETPNPANGELDLATWSGLTTM